MTSAAPAPSLPPTRPSALSIWVRAARPNTLPAAAAGVVVGLGAAMATGAPLRLDTALACLAVALLLQILANFSNDLSDFRRGADTEARQGPLRVAAAGLVTERQLEIAMAIVIGLAGVVGLYLVAVGGWVLLLLGVLAVVAAIAYTGGPFPYGYKALGEVFVFIFFGLVAVAGTAYLQTLTLEPLYLAAAVPPGALITAILVVNNLRDIPTDTEAGKRTLARRDRGACDPGRVRAAPRGRVRGAHAAPILVVDCRHAVGWIRGPRRHRCRAPPAHPAARAPAAREGLRVWRAPGAQSRPQGNRPALALARAPVRPRARARGRHRWRSVLMPSMEITRVRVPFRAPFTNAARTWTARDSWLVKVTSDDGVIGWGEAVLEDLAAAPALERLVARVRLSTGRAQHRRPSRPRVRQGAPCSPPSRGPPPGRAPTLARVPGESA